MKPSKTVYSRVEEHALKFGRHAYIGKKCKMTVSRRLKEEGMPRCSHLSDGGREANMLARLHNGK